MYNSRHILFKLYSYALWIVHHARMNHFSLVAFPTCTYVCLSILYTVGDRLHMTIPYIINYYSILAEKGGGEMYRNVVAATAHGPTSKNGCARSDYWHAQIVDIRSSGSSFSLDTHTRAGQQYVYITKVKLIFCTISNRCARISGERNKKKCRFLGDLTPWLRLYITPSVLYLHKLSIYIKIISRWVYYYFVCVSLNIKCKPLETHGRHLCDDKIPFCFCFLVFLGPGDETDE